MSSPYSFYAQQAVTLLSLGSAEGEVSPTISRDTDTVLFESGWSVYEAGSLVVGEPLHTSFYGGFYLMMDTECRAVLLMDLDHRLSSGRVLRVTRSYSASFGQDNVQYMPFSVFSSALRKPVGEYTDVDEQSLPVVEGDFRSPISIRLRFRLQAFRRASLRTRIQAVIDQIVVDGHLGATFWQLRTSLVADFLNPPIVINTRELIDPSVVIIAETDVPNLLLSSVIVRDYDTGTDMQPNSPGADSIGSVEGLKRQAVVDFADDDVLLKTLFVNAAQLVGSLTEWPMRTSDHGVTATYYAARPAGRKLRIPGPVKRGSVIMNGVPVSVEHDHRLPHDAFIAPSQDLIGCDINVEYVRSWSSWYPMPGWPESVATAIYRVAATLYAYREATPLGDGPVRRILSSVLGPAVGSGRGRPGEAIEL